MQKNNLQINKTAGIVGICGAIALFISTMIFVSVIGVNPTSLFRIDESTLMLIGFLGLLNYGAAIPSIVLYSIALSRTKKAGLSTTGHVLGIVGAGTYFVVPYLLDFICMGLMIVGSIMILRLKEPDTHSNTNEFEANDFESF